MKKLLDKLFNRKGSGLGNPENLAATAELKSPPNGNEAATAPLSEEQLEQISVGDKRINPTQLVVGAARDVGKTRNKNEDSLFAFSSLIGTSTSSLPLGIFMVADGMGGHSHGEMASETAVRTMSSYLVGKLFNPLYGNNPSPPEESLQEIMRVGIFDAHNRIEKTAPGGGTTLTAIITIGTQMTIAHVGDSRAYNVFLDGRMQLLTRDHSLVKRLEELGQITAEEAEHHPQKSMLYRALGQGDAPDPDIFTASMPQPGYILICSDGLWGVLTEDQIFQIISESTSPQRACQNLVDAANTFGGPDNITVILAKLSG
ncbi:MAG: serine/threonine-protein phosphatase [Anaerolineales bacterium]|nr:serine/threonine-protein phosphatase [Anaerolineales bacterium]